MDNVNGEEYSDGSASEGEAIVVETSSGSSHGEGGQGGPGGDGSTPPEKPSGSGKGGPGGDGSEPPAKPGE